jgi:hypothetical protein
MSEAIPQLAVGARRNGNRPLENGDRSSGERGRLARCVTRLAGHPSGRTLELNAVHGIRKIRISRFSDSTVAKEGSLLISKEGDKSIWRVGYGW